MVELQPGAEMKQRLNRVKAVLNIQIQIITMNKLLKKVSPKYIIPVFAILVLFSCKKNVDEGRTGITDIPPDLSTTVTASVVSGFVTDENNAAVMSASVSVGSTFAITDKYGFFEIKNVSVIKNAAVVTVIMPGYFKGIKTYIADENKAAFFRIKLIPKTNTGIINATTGGNVSTANGLVVTLPANGVMNPFNNAAYTGSVNVAVHWIDPSSTDLNQTMPGDLRGINTSGSLKLLTTYGMMAIQLTGSSGELLQIATGKKATLIMPIPAVLSGSAPATIPLWYFDEGKGLWKEEGQATKTGNTYVGEVSHFSFWNFDDPGYCVQFNCTVKDNAGNPVPYALVKVSVVNSYTSAWGYTDSSGYVNGSVPNNAQLLLEIFANNDCSTPIYSQQFSTNNTDISLGVISIDLNFGAATVSGTVTNCSNNPVTNGYIMMWENHHYYRYPLSNTGSYNFTTLLCGTTINANFIAEDMATAQQSTVLTQTLSTGPNTIGNLHACAVSTDQFVTYTINGGAPVTFTWPTDSIIPSLSPFSMSDVYGGNSLGPTYAFIYFYTTGIGAGNTISLEGFTTYNTIQINAHPHSPGSIPMNIHITEYGAVGEFIAGNFSGPLLDDNSHSVYNVTCSFRARRRN